MKRVKLLCFIALFCAATSLTWGQTIGPLATWDFSSSTGWGPSIKAASSTNPNVTTGGLARGPGLDTVASTSPAINAWGASGFNDSIAVGAQSAATAEAKGNYVSFTVSATPGFSLSVSSISAYNIRKASTSGPAAMQWQYSLDGTTFTNIGTIVPTGGSFTSLGNNKPPIPLSDIVELQNVPFGTTITFRILIWSATANLATWYLNGAGQNSSLIVNGVVNSTPLPLSLLHFKGERVNDDNRLDWLTAREEHVAYYQLERSMDGRSFDKIATLSARGNNSTEDQEYSYTDKSITATAYYRLNMVDRDGKAGYSNIVLIRKDFISNKVQVYPNPAGSALYFEGLRGKGTYSITDAMGREVFSSSFEGNAGIAVPVNVSGLAKGIYFLRLTQGDKREAIKFVKE